MGSLDSIIANFILILVVK